MRPVLAGAGSVALLVAPPAAADELHSVRIPATSLKEAIRILSAQTRSSIALADPALGDLRIQRVSGRMTAGQALRRILARLPVEITMIDPATYRLRRGVPRRKPAASASRPPRARPLAVKTEADPEPVDIVVTAAKRDVRAMRFPGALQIVTGKSLEFAESDGTAALSRAVTSLSMTHFGSGRDKLILRAVGDSSFSGHSQATVGQYLGEARLNFAGPDPDLRLYDVRDIQLLMGPQGTLYGAGSLGGIIRVDPNLPDLKAPSAYAMGSASIQPGGAPGAEIAGTVNLPLRSGGSGVRLVGYHVREGGYIDDAGRGVANSNALSVTGFRGMFALEPAESWRVDLAAVGQTIAARDAVYADRRLAPLTRSSAIAQPYTNRFRLLSATVTHSGDLDAVVSVSRSHGRLVDISDASEPLPDKFSLARRESAVVTALEARVSRSDPDGAAWLAGLSVVDSGTRSQSALNYSNGNSVGARARVSVGEYTLYGEASEAMGPLTATLGGRIGHRAAKGDITAVSRDEGTTLFRHRGWRLLPSASLFGDLPWESAMFLRYAQSYRPPTVAVTPDDAQMLSGDLYAAWEFGIRLLPRAGRTVTGRLSLSRGRWKNVQADVLNDTGFLTATNIGNAKLATLEANIEWRLWPTVEMEAAMSLNHASVRSDRPSTIIVLESRLPNVPDVNAQIGWRLSSPDHAAHPYRISGRLRYIGRSTLGLGPILGRQQGDFVEFDVEASVVLREVKLFAGASNLLGSTGNRFAIGSIAQPNMDELFVPQQPRTLKFGIRMNLP